MTHLMQTLRTRVQKRAQYNATYSELRALPLDIKLDLDISGVEDKVAHRAVYG